MTSDLITRLSKLDAPDREVDAQIYILFNIPAERAGRIDYSNGMVGWWPKDGPYVSAVTVPAYTESIEVVIAQARRLWSDVMYRVGNDGEGPDPSLYLGELFIPGEQKDSYFTGLSPVDAVSLCIALLRAKEASNAE
ncbi:MAG TPA: hypothetical protein DD739_10565 [Ochrobactrum anthropi]|nr:hypothetical protein [Brucella anthropi]